MKIVNKFLSITGISVISILIYHPNNIALAQFRGQDSQQFFDRGNQLIEQQIQQIEQQNRQPIEENQQKKEELLENNLEVKSPDDLEIKEVPDSPESLSNNVPEAPNQEIKIQQN
ncbi:hypothetical protein [Geminocystis sp. GBBB08]|uniref:hypothetical protein n=1 Tax=Geminocystis sp. GBBB08 TaxID=2604140 RepID=UPI0027E3320B|nr:hypothetical protein [Geminocystis sp. GBBB08]MBL1210862.1 hypothetical protein [Geminocystis sp. GBBB08]